MIQRYAKRAADARTGGDGGDNRDLCGRRTLRYALILFGVFLIYFYFSSNVLPIGAGPDYTANNDAVHFLYTYERLAVMPQDENKVGYSPAGGTRVLRPPFGYIVSAGMAKVLDTWIQNRFILFRKGSALLGAATVAVAFYAGVLYFNSYTAGLFAALLFGLLPQFAFQASYNNDDSGAIFSATLLLCALVRIRRKGVNWPNAVLLGFAGGLVILSKQTAWLLAPTVALFLAIYVRGSWKSLAKYASVGLAVLVLSGGWWVLYNIYHYGPGDPFTLKIEQTLAAKHQRYAANKDYGYKAVEVGYKALLFEDYDAFWEKTIASTIGNLDWLRIRLGPLQYGLYLAFFVLAIVYVIVRLCGLLYRRVKSKPPQDADGDVMLEVLLLFALAFQFYMYMWTNINNDIQLQGRYLLPAFLAIVLLGISAARSILRRVAPVVIEDNPKDVLVSGSGIRKWSVVGTAGLLVAIHVDAIFGYVIPFYRPTIHPMYLHRGFSTIAIPPGEILRKHEMDQFAMTATGFRFVSTGVDPWFVVSLSDREMCRLFSGYNVLKARINAGKKGRFKVYIDKGQGFREEDASGVRYPAGESIVVLVFDVPRCSSVRIDPAVSATSVEVSDLSLGKIVVDE
ncbi:MAG: glycosyltransferase family 39 protein [Arenicellales bacterium]